MPKKTDLGARPAKLPIALPEGLYECLRGSAFERLIPMARIVREALVAYQGQLTIPSRDQLGSPEPTGGSPPVVGP
jgi:hypothetical protein